VIETPLTGLKTNPGVHRSTPDRSQNQPGGLSRDPRPLSRLDWAPVRAASWKARPGPARPCSRPKRRASKLRLAGLLVRPTFDPPDRPHQLPSHHRQTPHIRGRPIRPGRRAHRQHIYPL